MHLFSTELRTQNIASMHTSVSVLAQSELHLSRVASQLLQLLFFCKYLQRQDDMTIPNIVALHARFLCYNPSMTGSL